MKLSLVALDGPHNMAQPAGRETLTPAEMLVVLFDWKKKKKKAETDSLKKKKAETDSY